MKPIAFAVKSKLFFAVNYGFQITACEKFNESFVLNLIANQRKCRYIRFSCIKHES